MVEYVVTQYSNLCSAVQTDLYKLISEDTTSITFENSEASSLSEIKVIDGSVSFEMQNMAFPLILVHTPTPDDDFYSFTKLKSEIDLEIEVFATREKNVRLILDRIRSLLQSSQSTTRTYKLEFYKSKVLGIGSTWTKANGNERLIHSASLMVKYRFYDVS